MKDWIMQLCPEIAEWQAEIIYQQVRIRVMAEREACAKVVEASPSYDWHRFACEAAAAIRARSNT